jgi:hypothetical protein
MLTLIGFTLPPDAGEKISLRKLQVAMRHPRKYAFTIGHLGKYASI